MEQAPVSGTAERVEIPCLVLVDKVITELDLLVEITVEEHLVRVLVEGHRLGLPVHRVLLS
jgi:hypothetical protein